jgi:hypothetical protein
MAQQRGVTGRRRAAGRLLSSVLTLAWLAFGVASVGAATRFFDPAFQQQWQAGEALAPNFWGPLATAREGTTEPYLEAKGGERVVQYFDKGRMEITNSTTRVVTNGLLATELITGNQQMGDATFKAVPPPAIPIAGDPDTIGPTYASLGGSSVRNPFVPRPNVEFVSIELLASGEVKPFPDGKSYPPAFIADYDEATRHNIPRAFASYRQRVGLGAIGLAIAEPFWAHVKVGGMQKAVLVQAFERRVLTYTPINSPAFQIEMGNIGQHYARWRYGG